MIKIFESNFAEMYTHMHTALNILVLVVILLLACKPVIATADPDGPWVVIVCTSRYWFNYRHQANALSIYKEVRDLGVPDERIILMSALDAAGDVRNAFPGEIYSTNIRSEMETGRRSKVARQGNMTSTGTTSESKRVHSFSIVGDVQMDYSGDDCNADSFLRLLTGRHSPGMPWSRQLHSTENSKVMIYITGHGGDEFLKFHDKEELSAADLAFALRQMYLQRRYGELLVVVDSCQASTLGNYLDVPNITLISSSGLGENSFAFDTNHQLGLAVIDRFTHKMQEYLARHREKHIQYLASEAASRPCIGKRQKVKVKAPNTKKNDVPSVASFVKYMLKPQQRNFLFSAVHIQQTVGSHRSPHDMPLVDFFGKGAVIGGQKETECAAEDSGTVFFVNVDENDAIEEGEEEDPMRPSLSFE